MRMCFGERENNLISFDLFRLFSFLVLEPPLRIGEHEKCQKTNSLTYTLEFEVVIRFNSRARDPVKWHHKFPPSRRWPRPPNTQQLRHMLGRVIMLSHNRMAADISVFPTVQYPFHFFEFNLQRLFFR
jgi:hypothetical protein